MVAWFGKTKKMSSGGVVVLELPLGAAEEEEESFELEKAVCSHGLFVMPPNQWDPVSKTLLRPLRLGDSDSESVMVRISQHQWAPHSLHVRVYCHNSPDNIENQCWLRCHECCVCLKMRREL